MRLYPPVPGFFRDIKEEVTLGDAVIPKNTTVYINTFAIHHNDSIWDNPDEFDTGLMTTSLFQPGAGTASASISP